MDLLVAYKDDHAGNNMAKFISRDLDKDNDIHRGTKFDVLTIPSPTISADWLEQKFDYDNYIFLSNLAVSKFPVLWHVSANVPDSAACFERNTYLS